MSVTSAASGRRSSRRYCRQPDRAMGLRLRRDDGAIVEIPAGIAAVEICSTDGKLVRVFVLRKDGGIVSMNPKDKEFREYARVMGAETGELIHFKS